MMFEAVKLGIIPICFYNKEKFFFGINFAFLSKLHKKNPVLGVAVYKNIIFAAQIGKLSNVKLIVLN